MRVQEPAVDLAIVAALASSVTDRPLPARAIFLGELGLGGEVRPVSQAERRLAEASKLGMTQAFLSDRAVPRRVPDDMEVIGVRTIADVLRQTVGQKTSVPAGAIAR
jgi:DNA repair protein RadA/Sms